MLLKPGASILLPILLLLTNIKPALSSAKDPQVQWVSPSAGDRYGPGDSILAQWTSDSPVVSPAFKLCQGEPHASVGSLSEDQGDDDNETCGSEVYPAVQQSSGTSSTSLAVPNTTTEQEWYVVMIDDFRNTWSSSPFYLSPQGDSNVASAADAQAPLSVQPQTPTAASTVVVVPVTAAPVPVAEPDSASSAAATSMLATRTPPPTAAFAVPLPIVAAILLVAVFLSLRHNRKLAEERAQDVEKLVLSRKSSVASSFRSGYSRQSDIEHALNMLSKAQSQGDVKTVPVPLFMPVEVPQQRQPRRCTREAYQTKQYTEYYRPSQERPPSYRSAPLSSSRSQSRTRSLLSSISSRSRASSRTAIHPLDSRSYRPSLPPVRVGSPLHCSEYEYAPEEHRDETGAIVLQGHRDTMKRLIARLIQC